MCDKKKRFEDFPNPEFQEGMIIRIKLAYFMTYEKVEIHAQPKLNFILGPNGTGKSTFLCAVILGLGGKPSIIGRSTNVAHYIKRGCDKANILIELFNPDGMNYVICRSIMSDSSSIWGLQKKVVPFQDVAALIQKLNIQINNLCMILPQDRVQDFTKMNKKELLENTQKLIGHGELEELFTKLCNVRSKMKEQSGSLKIKAKRCDEEMQVLKSMEVDVKSYRERHDLLNKIEVAKKKEAWLTYEEKSTVMEQLNEELKKLMVEYDSAKQLLKPFLSIVKEGQKKELELSGKGKALNKVVIQAQEKLNELKRQFLKLKSKISSIKEDLKEKIEADERKKVEIGVLKVQLNSIMDYIPKHSVEELCQQIKDVESKTEELMKQYTSLKSKENEINSLNSVVNQQLKAIEHRLNQAESVREKKLALLQNFKDVHAAYLWLTENSHSFTGAVYGPLFIELNVKNSGSAKYIEKVVPFRDLVAFACENSEDVTKLLILLRDTKHLKINVLNAVPPRDDISKLYPPPYPISDIRKFGFHSYLIDLVEGPPALMSYLCSNYGLHRIPLGSDQVLEHSSELPSNIKLFFSKDKVFQIKTSHYSGEKSQTIIDLAGAKFLGYSVNLELISSLKEEKEAQMRAQLEGQQKLADLLESRQKIEVDLNRSRDDRRVLSKDLEYLKSTNVRLRMKKEELARLTESSFDRNAEECKTKQLVNEAVKEIVALHSQYLQMIQEHHEKYKQAKLLELQIVAVGAKISSDEKELKKQESQSLKLKERIEKIKSDVAKAQTEAKLFYSKAKVLTDGLDPDDQKFAQKYREIFSNLPNNLDNLKEYLGQSEAMLRCLQDSLSDKVVRNYDEKKYLLGQMNKDLERCRTEYSVAQQECLDLQNQWLPQITDLISNINAKFSQSFTFLKCAGGVELDRGENEDEFENYGINMKVKFRNDGDMRVLNQYSQSGGEKALSIAFYLLSLQSIIKVPFRWVDEINQGMDEYNEVRVYYLMMCEVANDPHAQCFVITPKLVPGLKMSSETTVHVIYSGNLERKSENEDENSVKTSKVSKLSSTNRLHWSKEKYFKYLGIA